MSNGAQMFRPGKCRPPLGRLGVLLALCVWLCASIPASSSSAAEYGLSEENLAPYDSANGIDIPILMGVPTDRSADGLGLPVDSYHLEISVDEKHRVKFNGLPLEKARKKMSDELTSKVMAISAAEGKILDSAVSSEKGDAVITYKVDIEKEDMDPGNASSYYVLRQLIIKSDNMKLAEEETQRIYIKISEDGNIAWALITPPKDETHIEYMGTPVGAEDLDNYGAAEHVDCSDPSALYYSPDKCGGAGASSNPGRGSGFYSKVATRSAYGLAGVASCVFLFKMARRYSRNRRINSLRISSYMPLNGPSAEKPRGSLGQSLHDVVGYNANYENVKLDPESVARRELSAIKSEEPSDDDGGSAHTTVRITLKGDTP